MIPAKDQLQNHEHNMYMPLKNETTCKHNV
jgi:hypothetical protein